MNTPIADKKYKREVVRLVKKLPFNVGVYFLSETLPYKNGLQVVFRLLRGERQHSRSIYVHDHQPPPDYVVKRAAFDLTEAVMFDEEDES